MNCSVPSLHLCWCWGISISATLCGGTSSLPRMQIGCWMHSNSSLWGVSTTAYQLSNVSTHTLPHVSTYHCAPYRILTDSGGIGRPSFMEVTITQLSSHLFALTSHKRLIPAGVMTGRIGHPSVRRLTFPVSRPQTFLLLLQMHSPILQMLFWRLRKNTYLGLLLAVDRLHHGGILIAPGLTVKSANFTGLTRNLLHDPI